MRKLFSDVRTMSVTVNPIIFTLLVLSIVGMNLLANKMVDTGLEWLPLDGGILLSWLCFLSMDILTHCYGPRVATTASYAALAMNLFMALVFFIASRVPGVWGESFVPEAGAVNLALDNTFGGTWYIIMGSSIAFALSALVNNFLNWGIGERVGEKGTFGVFALRSYVSTFTAQFVDNLTFGLIVSRTFFGWTLPQCVACACTGAILELLFEVLFSPIGYRISRGIIAERSATPALEEEIA